MAEKEVTARVRVERDGDTGAVRELADDLRSLESPAREAGDAAEEAGRDFLSFSERLKNTGEVLDELREDLRSSPGDVANLGEALEQKFPLATRAVKEGAAAVEAFKQSFEATRQVIDFVEAEFGISIDRMVTDALRLEEVGTQIVDFFQGTSEATSELLLNQRRIFENLGLDGLSSDVERNAQIIEEHFRSIGEKVSEGSQFLSRYGLDAREATEAAKTFASEFNAALEGLGEKSGRLAEHLRSYASSFEQDRDNARQQRATSSTPRARRRFVLSICDANHADSRVEDALVVQGVHLVERRYGLTFLPARPRR